MAEATQVEIGLYRRPALDRLPAADALGRPIVDRLLVPLD